jgi:2-polyprenyl-6-hydroxyphenyl methylase/3-demethylubiquinone-9 3-methyltransferase
MPMTSTETVREDRFAFGENWCDFTQLVDEARIASAVESLTGSLAVTDLAARSFLDIGCGSGLFSLAAHRLGARVHSFDYDAQCVVAAGRLRSRFAPHSDWTIEEGSILAEDYTKSLGQFDVVYAWGVLHHTGDLWRAVDAAADRVAPGGTLFISVYNDQGAESWRWLRIKRRYNRSSPWLRRLLVARSVLRLARGQSLRSLAAAALRRFSAAASPGPRARGMSARHDLLDWVGGYPFEVAKPERVFAAVHRLGFELRYLTTCGGGIGCNEYVFERVSPPAPPR